MRVYFEKPRTTVGWKGLINDPDLDDSFHIEKGILLARELLLYVAELGLPAGTEALDPIMPQYLSELITWTAIGAAPRNRRPIGRWQAAYRPRSDSRTAPTASLGHLDQRARVGAPSASFPGDHPAGPVGGVSHPRQSARPHRAARRRRTGQLRCGEHRARRAGALAGESAGQHRGRLQPRQFQQGSERSAAGGRELRGPDPRRQPLDRRA